MNKIIKIFLIALMLILIILALLWTQTPNRIIYNLQVKGYLFGTSTLRGEQTWGYNGTLDTLVVSGVDANCYVYLTPLTATGVLSVTSVVADTIFVTSSTSETATTDKYNYLILR